MAAMMPRQAMGGCGAVGKKAGKEADMGWRRPSGAQQVEFAHCRSGTERAKKTTQAGGLASLSASSHVRPSGHGANLAGQTRLQVRLFISLSTCPMLL
jgi:hypothetical protein